MVNASGKLREVEQEGVRRVGEHLVPNAGRVRLYIAEEQQMLRDTYRAFFLARPEVEVLGASEDTRAEAVVRAVQALKPDLALLGIRVLRSPAVELVGALHERCPGVGLVLLAAQCESQSLRDLRECFRSVGAGCGFILKYNLDTMDQLADVVKSVAQGHIILDPQVMAGLVAPSDVRVEALRNLPPREVEVLRWMAKGYTNTAIATALGLEPKVVDRLVGEICTRLGGRSAAKDARVHAVEVYLKATGLLQDPTIDPG